jgi:parallel beta-helix repeat protein
MRDKMSSKKKKKSLKERQRERQIKQQRTLEAYRIRREREALRKPRKWSKGKIFGIICLAILIFGAYGVWQFTRPSTVSEGSTPYVPTSKTFYIRADGSVDPFTISIRRVGEAYYIFTGNVSGSIMVERDNIVIDGAGFTLRGMFNGTVGVGLTGRRNVTIKNLKVIGFDYGIGLLSSFHINISHNYLANNYGGILMRNSSNNFIFANNITSNLECGVWLNSSHNNTLFGNTIMLNAYYGMYIEVSIGNLIYHNNFVNNTAQVYNLSSKNIWDDKYSSSGNYWSDYKARYPDASERNGSGVWDKPYLIDENNQDNYPLIYPYCS